MRLQFGTPKVHREWKETAEYTEADYKVIQVDNEVNILQLTDIHYDASNNRKEELNTQQYPSGRVLSQRSKQVKNHIDQRKIDSIIIRTCRITRNHAGSQFLRVRIDSTKEMRSVSTWEADVWDKESL